MHDYTHLDEIMDELDQIEARIRLWNQPEVRSPICNEYDGGVGRAADLVHEARLVLLESKNRAAYEDALEQAEVAQ
jgi:hypothetical protein